MDKLAANNHIVSLKKEVKNAKAMVSGNLIRRIKEMKEKREKQEDEAKAGQLDARIEKMYFETKLIHSLDSYLIAKKVTMNPSKSFWERLLSDNLATPEERLTCRIALKNNVQKCVAKFRNDFKDCDEWLEEYFEFREKKKQLHEAAYKKNDKKKKISRDIPKGLREQSGTTQSSSWKKTRMMNERSKSDVDEMKYEKPTASTKNSCEENLHPSWASRKREKMLLQAAISGKVKPPKRIVFGGD